MTIEIDHMPGSTDGGREALKRHRVSALLVAVGAPLVLLLSTLSPATPALSLVTPVPGVVPTATTPQVSDGLVDDVAEVGDTIVLAGTFTDLTNTGAPNVHLARQGVASFNVNTGVVTPGFAPTLDGLVTSVIPAGDGAGVFVGGRFEHVNGEAATRVVRLDLSTGQVVPTFSVDIPRGEVRAMVLSQGVLYVGGTFTEVGGLDRGGLVALDPTTGDVLDTVDVSFTEDHGAATGGPSAPVGLQDLAVSPDGTRLVAIGNFMLADGLSRPQIAMLSLSGTAAVMEGWETQRFAPACLVKFPTYMRGVDFSTNGRYFVVVTTGGRIREPEDLCDAASRWETAATGAEGPTWVAQTGADTLLSVAVRNNIVYVGGHQRWLNNSGVDAAGPGAVPRPGIAALQANNGLPIAWNPGRNPRGFGTTALLATERGLWVGSDTNSIGDGTYVRKKIAYFRYADGNNLAPGATDTLPGDVYEFAPVGASVKRVNRISFNGTQTTSRAAPSFSGTVGWQGMRGAVIIDDYLYYGTAAGRFFRRSFTGDSLGPIQRINPYHDPVWSNVQTGSDQTYKGKLPSFYAEIPFISAMFYNGGRLYYTRSDSPDLYWRSFSVDSGVIAQTVNIVANKPVDWSTTQGVFLAGPWLYVADRATGTLSRIAFNDGALDTSRTALPSAGNLSTRWNARGLVVFNP